MAWLGLGIKSARLGLGSFVLTSSQNTIVIRFPQRRLTLPFQLKFDVCAVLESSASWVKLLCNCWMYK